MKLIGLTGGIATGKSTVSKIIQAQGLPVIDADVLAREVVEPASFGLRALVQIFGREILKNSKESSSELNRSKLGQILFSDPSSRQVVENITHPLIQWRAQQEFAFLKRNGEKIVFYDAALLFEKDLVKNFDHILVVHTSRDIQIRRLMERDKLERALAEQRVDVQWPMDKKIAGANFLVDNSRTPKETEDQVKKIISDL